MCRNHAIKVRRRGRGAYHKDTCHTCERLVTLQFTENQACLQVDFLGDSINCFSEENHWNIPMELQDEGVPMDNTDLGAVEDQPHNTTMGPQCPDTYDIDFHIDHLFSPALESGLSCALHHRQVFNLGPDSEPKEEGDREGEYISTSPYQSIHDSRPIRFQL